MVEPRTLKGFRDFLPETARKRQYMIAALKKVFEAYGFEPLETPVLEYEEILAGKYGDEGEKLMYRFEDQGGRLVAMRYDQTVPLSRVVAQYRNDLPNPFKRYQIQPVWRAENTQKGRYREFFQADIDTVGSTSVLSDAEILAVIYESYHALGFSEITIRVNDRNVFQDLSVPAIITIDKLQKIGEEAVIAQLQELGVSQEVFESVKNAKCPENLTRIIDHAVNLGVSKNAIVFDSTLARGLDYYTGIIIEVELPGYDAGSLGGGGRYDNLIGMFGKELIPAVGFAFGFDRTLEAMESMNLFPKHLTTSQILVTIFSLDFVQESLRIAHMLRDLKLNTEIYLDENAKMDKQMKYADKKKIPYVVILGPDEVQNKKIKFKNMHTGEQMEIEQDNLSQIFQ